ncbi:ATP-binding protein [Desulfobacula sp.]|uniref:ATP-binding protein n=1 Tax=Desulfobacula sp. TaxID=2593537 RepID=UPI0026143BD8|nr:ATP-binding protein [Desulfobacula sp.]
MIEKWISDGKSASISYADQLENIENVVRNAIRYTNESTTVNISIEAKNSEKDPVILIIEDNGPGVPSINLPHLFKPFYRVEGDRGRKTGGTGVGLAIADRAIKLHDGEIRAENSKDGGLKIIITIPKTIIAG